MESLTAIARFVGDGCGNGYGYGYGTSAGYGTSDGTGDGTGDCFGSGNGYGTSYGTGLGDGDGYGYVISYEKHAEGIAAINGRPVCYIDGMPTIITAVRGDVAKGYVLMPDLSLRPYYVAKSGKEFAHGKTLTKAVDALQAKLFAKMDTGEKVSQFIEEHTQEEAYSVAHFFEWHHRLTGSCEAGRRAFVENERIDLTKMYTVNQFISATENAYGGDIIKALGREWFNTIGKERHQ